MSARRHAAGNAGEWAAAEALLDEVRAAFAARDGDDKGWRLRDYAACHEAALFACQDRGDYARAAAVLGRVEADVDARAVGGRDGDALDFTLRGGGEYVDSRESRRAAQSEEYAKMLADAVASGEAPPTCDAFSDFVDEHLEKLESNALLACLKRGVVSPAECQYHIRARLTRENKLSLDEIDDASTYGAEDCHFLPQTMYTRACETVFALSLIHI